MSTSDRIGGGRICRAPASGGHAALVKLDFARGKEKVAEVPANRFTQKITMPDPPCLHFPQRVMHHDTNIKYVHNYIKSSRILVTEPGYRARICHLGSSYLAEEYDTEGVRVLPQRSSMKITRTQGYMAPEYINNGIVSQKVDVFALGVVLLELLSRHEPIRYVADEGGYGIRRIGIIQSLNIVISEADDNFAGRLRRWIDPRLRDSFPVDCVVRVARLAGSCVDPDPGNRLDTRYVAGELSRVFIMSEQWSERMNANKTCQWHLRGQIESSVFHKYCKVNGFGLYWCVLL